MKRSKKLKSELPDCVLSYIFSKLSLKDLVKTSTLSKRWLYEWGLRMDLNFDLDNMFDDYNNTLQELPKSLPLFQGLQSQFATRLDQVMLHYQGSIILSIRLNFPLGHEHSDVIDKMISKGIDKGVKRIELLFSYQTTNDPPSPYLDQIEPYTFPLALFSETDSLMYLRLEKCHLVAPTTDFSGLKNLRTLVLRLVDVKQDMIQCLLSNCIHLLDFTLDTCKFKSDLKIISPTLFHFNILNCGVKIHERRNIDIIASNLSSLEYFCNGRVVHIMNIKEAQMLSKFSFRGGKISQRVGFSGLKHLTTIVLDGLSECLQFRVVPLLFSECLQLEDVTFKNCSLILELDIISPKLRHLNIIDCGFEGKRSPDINIDALNLSSFEYSGHTKGFYVKAPNLLKVFWNAAKRDKNPYLFGPIATLNQIENLAMILSHSQIELSTILLRFQNLRTLELFINDTDDPNSDYFWILDIAMASQHLQKLSLTIRNSHMENSHMVEFERQRREYAGFSHNDLKYVELRGCVCTINAIELASNILRNANSLQQITFTSRNRFYIGAGGWTEGCDSCWFDKNLIHKMLQDDVNEQCRLVIL